MKNKPNTEGKGFKEALKLLWSLTGIEQKRLIAQMKKIQPEMAFKLEDELITFEHLIYITQRGLVDLLKEVSREDFALSLRISSLELRSHLLNIVGASLKSEILEIVAGPPRSVEMIEKSKEKVMVVVKKMAQEGRLVLSAQKDEYV